MNLNTFTVGKCRYLAVDEGGEAVVARVYIQLDSDRPLLAVLVEEAIELLDFCGVEYNNETHQNVINLHEERRELKKEGGVVNAKRLKDVIEDKIT